MRRRAPISILLTALPLLSLLAAGCGGGSSNPGVARLSAGASRGHAVSGSGSSSPDSTASTQQRMVAYAQCMRAHGVPSFPDPPSSGAVPKGAAVRALKEVGNSQAEAAQTACRRMQPNGGQSSRAEVAQHISALLAFAGCMRTHGTPRFPDPTSGGQVTHEMLREAGIDVHQPEVLQAADTCVSVTHGVLTRAAVARFAAGR